MVTLTTILKALPPNVKLKNCINGEVKTVKKWRQEIGKETDSRFGISYGKDRIIYHINFGEIFIEQGDNDANKYNSIWQQ